MKIAITRKILFGSLMLGLLLSVGVYSSYALFSAKNSLPGGVFTVGTLDLSVSEPTGGASEKFVIDNIGAEPEARGSKSWLVKNTGTLPGKLSLSIASYNNNENDCNEQESQVDSSCGNPGSGDGELGNVIRARILVDDNEVVTWTKAFASRESLSQVWSQIPPLVLAGGSQSKIALDWEIKEGDYGNEIQSDSLEFNISFNLEQTPK